MENKFEVKYQFTKVASDLYNIYDLSSNSGDFLNTKSLCDVLIKKRGGVALTQDFYDILDGSENGDTFGITESALSINRVAKEHGIEPWKLAEVDGQQVFVSASTGCEVEEDGDKKVKKTASKHMHKHTYKVAIHTGTFLKASRLHKKLIASGYNDEDIYLNIANPETLVLTLEDENMPSKVIDNMQEKYNDQVLSLNKDDFECCHDYCDCGEELFDFSTINNGEFVLLIPNLKPMIGRKMETLRDYASANNFDNFKICASDSSVVYDSALKEAIEEIDSSMPPKPEWKPLTFDDVFRVTDSGIKTDGYTPNFYSLHLFGWDPVLTNGDYSIMKYLEDDKYKVYDHKKDDFASDVEYISINEAKKSIGVEEKTADSSMPKEVKAERVFEDENTHEFFSEEQLKALPPSGRKFKEHDVTSSYLTDMFKESSVIDLTSSKKNLLIAALNYCGFEKVAYLSDDSFSIKAGEAIITVDNDKAKYIPLSTFDNVCCEEQKEEKDSIL